MQYLKVSRLTDTILKQPLYLDPEWQQVRPQLTLLFCELVQETRLADAHVADYDVLKKK